MIQDRVIQQLIEGLDIRGGKPDKDSPKLLAFIVDSEDRKATSLMMSARVKKMFGKHLYGKVAGSSEPIGIEFEHKNRIVRLVFKQYSGSAAALNTPWFEAAQCLYMAAAQVKRGPITTAWVSQNLAKLTPFYDTKYKGRDMLDKLDKQWRKSSELIANHTYPKLRHNSFVFHHHSSVVCHITETYKRLNQNPRLFTREDKWNPADVWLVRRGFRPNFSKVQSFDEFNSDLRELLDKGDLIGVSLKLVHRQPKVGTYNTNEYLSKKTTAAPVAQTEFIDAKINTGGKNWLSSKNCIIQLAKGKTDMTITIRQSSRGAAVNGELKFRGQKSNSGKIILGKFISLFKKYGVTADIPPNQELNKQSFARDSSLTHRVYELAMKLDKTTKVTPEEFKQHVDTKCIEDPHWLASKYAAMLLIEGLMKLSKENRVKVCEALYSHAAASDDLSGPYLKFAERV